MWRPLPPVEPAGDAPDLSAAHEYGRGEGSSGGRHSCHVAVPARPVAAAAGPATARLAALNGSRSHPGCGMFISSRSIENFSGTILIPTASSGLHGRETRRRLKLISDDWNPAVVINLTYLGKTCASGPCSYAYDWHLQSCVWVLLSLLK